MKVYVRISYIFRQYLNNEGYGYGTPVQRQRQYTKFKAARAANNVQQHQINKLTAKHETQLATRERATRKKQMTQNTLERLAEDLISESMAKGEFQNLPGQGKPLPDKSKYNPFMDFTSHKMNEILAQGIPTYFYRASLL